MTFCTECGARLTSGEAFCTECGSPRDAAAAVASVTIHDDPLGRPREFPGPSPAGGRGRTIAWAAGAFVVALGVVVAVGVLAGGEPDEPAATEPVASASASADVTISAPGPAESVQPVPTPSATTPAFPRPSTSALPVTPTTAPTVAPAPVQPAAPQSEPGVQEALALSELQAAGVLAGDEPFAVGKLRAGRWYPTLSSKCAGMGAYAALAQPLDLGPDGRIGMPDGRGEAYSFLGSQRILALQRYYQWRFGPDVVNVTTQSLGRVKTYESLCGSYPMWITLNAGVSFDSPNGALKWCRDNGFIANECGAYPAFMPEESPRWI